VQNTVETVQESVSNTVANVKSFFDIAHHVERHPWMMFGGSMLVGYLGGWLLTPRHETPPATPPATPPTPPEQFRAPVATQPEPAEQAGESWLGKIGERIAPEVEKLKGLAVGTLFGVARDMISRLVPEALKEQVTDVINNFTTDLGGKVIREPLVATQEDMQGNESRQQDQPSQPTAASKPTGGSSRKGEMASAGSRR